MDAEKIIELIRRQGAQYNPETPRLAKVTSPYPDIKIKLSNLELDKEFLLISSRAYLKDYLNYGDEVLVVPLDNRYLIVDKVVKIWVYFHF